MTIRDVRGAILRIEENIHDSEYKCRREGLDKGIYLIEIKGMDLFRGKLVPE